MITKKRQNNWLILEVEGASHLYASYPSWDKERMIICDLKTKKEWRGKGYASALLKRAIWEARRNGCKVIELEDCSDYYGLSSNIYIKCGFQYTEFLPTMELKL